MIGEIKANIYFNSPERSEWIETINRNRDCFPYVVNDEVIRINFNNKICLLEPFHIVILSCFIDEFKSKGYKVLLNFEDQETNAFLFKEVNIKRYWDETRVNHIESPKISDLNIWRITNSEKDAYSISIHDYFKRHYFADYDLSALKNALNELYCNVFDHAEAGGNAFSYVNYDQNERKIRVAICDFGKGIAKSLKDRYPNYTTDSIALEKSLEIGVSARTQQHNRGFGLDNVVSSLSSDNEFRIVSNKGLLRVKGNKMDVEKFDIDFDFKGTLIYFDISIDNFDKEEFITDFTFD